MNRSPASGDTPGIEPAASVCARTVVLDLLAEAALSFALAAPEATTPQPYDSYGEQAAEPPCLYREPKPSCGQTPGHFAAAETHEENAT